MHHNMYSRIGFVFGFEHLTQEEGEGGEDHHSGAHDPVPRIPRVPSPGPAGGLEPRDHFSHWR